MELKTRNPRNDQIPLFRCQLHLFVFACWNSVRMKCSKIVRDFFCYDVAEFTSTFYDERAILNCSCATSFVLLRWIVEESLRRWRHNTCWRVYYSHKIKISIIVIRRNWVMRATVFCPEISTCTHNAYLHKYLLWMQGLHILNYKASISNVSVKSVQKSKLLKILFLIMAEIQYYVLIYGCWSESTPFVFSLG